MKKIMKGEETRVHGIVELASAAQYIQEDIYGFLLTAEEEAETCFAGYGEPICFTCNRDNCPWYEER